MCAVRVGTPRHGLGAAALGLGFEIRGLDWDVRYIRGFWARIRANPRTEPGAQVEARSDVPQKLKFPRPLPVDKANLLIGAQVTGKSARFGRQSRTPSRGNKKHVTTEGPSFRTETEWVAGLRTHYSRDPDRLLANRLRLNLSLINKSATRGDDIVDLLRRRLVLGKLDHVAMAQEVLQQALVGRL